MIHLHHLLTIEIELVCIYSETHIVCRKVAGKLRFKGAINMEESDLYIFGYIAHIQNH